MTPNTKTEPAVGFLTELDATLVKSDTVNLKQVIRSIRANTAGIVKVTTIDGSTAQLQFGAGDRCPGMFVRIWATGTTATGLEGAL